MPEGTMPRDAGWRGRLAAGALGFSVFSVLWFVAAALGSKWGLWGWQFGLGTMTLKIGPILLMMAIAVSLVAIIAGLTRSPRSKPVILGIAALLVSGLSFGRIAGFGAQAGALPPLHDIQTDWSDPIMFSEMMLDARTAGGALNPVEEAPVLNVPASAQERWPNVDGRFVSEVQEEAEFNPETMSEPEDAPYPTIEPLILEAGMATVSAAVQNLVRARGWTMVTADAENGVFEATETSGWFGFKDDVAIHVTETEEGGTRVDMRSVSRVGLSDLGANATRVSEFLKDLRSNVISG